MSAQAASQQDHAASVTPSQAGWRVAAVQPLPGWRLHVRFNDGVEGEVEMEREVHAADAGVFAALADPAVFEAVHVVFGAVTWPGEIDLAPDAMHAEIKRHGRWVL